MFFRSFPRTLFPRMEGTGLTKEQFARTRKPFDYPVITRHEVKRGNGAILKELNDEEVCI